VLTAFEESGRVRRARLRGLRKILADPLEVDRESVQQRVKSYQRDPQCFLTADQINRDIDQVAKWA